MRAHADIIGITYTKIKTGRLHPTPEGLVIP
jgi:hypothetical protein